ncbi:MAG: hypothetical protein JW902_18830 [Syntrophaceae bacterium]|nr:hypothetical protein [Syntrophaceae bacterium]
MELTWQYSTVHNSACKVIERIGLPEVRQFRLSRCVADESEWRHERQSARQIVPEIRPLLMLKVQAVQECRSANG